MADSKNQIRRLKIVYIDPVTLAAFQAPLGILTGIFIYCYHRTVDTGDWSFFAVSLALICEIPLGIFLTWLVALIWGNVINFCLVISGGITVHVRDIEPKLSAYETKLQQFPSMEEPSFEQPANPG